MPKFLRTILVSGAEVNWVNRLIEAGPNDGVDGEELTKASAMFENDYEMVVVVINSRANGPTITARLLDNSGAIVAEQRLLTCMFDTEFPATFRDDDYRLTINRAAAEELTDLAAQEYAEQGGQFCPHCGEVELLRSAAHVTHDDGTRQLCVGVTCLSCEAAWSDQYTLSGLTAVRGPQVNVIPPATGNNEDAE